ncbi:twin-arginine translocase TatA/TatE family subunit [Thermodesulfitimonas autotrophica]|uniref:twin-arginine translocase TatA/TatE family subunit n=1 Tax=Thermodesulfitimonas autotrophica TaxID=1894989 RepID=UPI002FE3EEFC
MIPRIGPAELVLILGLVVVLFGPKKLPELGHSLGKTLREFRKSTQGADESNEAGGLAEKDGKAGEPVRS